MLPKDQSQKIQKVISIENYSSIASLKDEIRTQIEKYKKSNCEFCELILLGSNVLISFKQNN